MIDAAIAKRLALALPETVDESTSERLVFSVNGKGFAWTWLERIEAAGPRRPRLDVLAVRCSIELKEVLIESVPAIYFDDDHYRGFPAVLVRLPAIDEAELGPLLEGAWRTRAPKRLLARHPRGAG